MALSSRALILEIQGAVAAVEKALRLAQPGELLVVQADEVDETGDFVKQYVRARVPGREIDLNEALAAAGPPLLPEPEPVILPHHVEPQLVTGCRGAVIAYGTSLSE